MYSSRVRPVLLAAGLLLAAAPSPGAPAGVTAAAVGPFGPDTCVQGYVWRESTPDDHVCVDPRTRFFVKQDNRKPDEFRSPTGGPYGSDTCVSGFVWREAVPHDHRCVAPQVREHHKKFNERAPVRWGATAPRDNSGFVLGGVPYPFYYADRQYPIRSSYSGRDDLVVDAADRRVQTDGNRASQRFQFLRRGDGIAFENAFQLLDTASRNCLSVAGGSRDNGAGLALEGCGWRPNQVWYLQRRPDNNWELRARHSDKCLDAANPSLQAPPAGAHVQQWECIGGQNQAWRLFA